jgi:hypothetical protein
VQEIEFYPAKLFESSKSMQGFKSYAIFTELTQIVVEVSTQCSIYEQFVFFIYLFLHINGFEIFEKLKFSPGGKGLQQK